MTTKAIVIIAVVGVFAVALLSYLFTRQGGAAGRGFFGLGAPPYGAPPAPPPGQPPIGNGSGGIDPALQQINRGLQEGDAIVKTARNLWGDIADAFGSSSNPPYDPTLGD